VEPPDGQDTERQEERAAEEHEDPAEVRVAEQGNGIADAVARHGRAQEPEEAGTRRFSIGHEQEGVIDTCLPQAPELPLDGRRQGLERRVRWA
jgi:hypothetical protein